MAEISRKIHERATALVRSLAKQHISEDGSSSFLSVAYDTAWVSMVQKEDMGVKTWLFPGCFQYLLDIQGPDGGWHTGTLVDDTDIIINSMAALLAFKKHIAYPSNCKIPNDMELRIKTAKTLVQSKMDSWVVESIEHVGFEMLVPTLLRLLEAEGICFHLPGLQALMALNAKKLGKFDPHVLYSPTKSTLLHSLEAFIGKIDFDKLSHHKVSGSMMCSPASTAAYLMNSSRWDEEAEQYLSRVVSHGSKNKNSSVPSAFPTPIFELTWVLSTLILSGFTAEDLGIENVGQIRDFLDGHLQAGHGLLGFAPNVLPDADDTAKTILTLNLVEKPTSAGRLIAEFEATDHFKTYTQERNPSLSANCNVLSSLLHVPDPDVYVEQIFKAASFIRKSCWEGPLKDKWNISSQYSAMLASQVLMRLLRVRCSGKLRGLPENFFQDQIPIILFQILMRTLQARESTGSWNGGSIEISAYAVLTLVYLWPLPWATCVREKVEAAIVSGRLFLSQTLDTAIQPESIWIEKVLYGSGVLCEAHLLAALKAPIVNEPWGEAVLELTSITTTSVDKFLQFFSRLPLFAQEPRWRLRASLTEGFLFLPQLKRRSREIFLRTDMAEDKYLEYIPLTWTTVNNLKQNPLSASDLHEMMVLSMLNYQVDEYMEAVVGKYYKDRLPQVRHVILELCREPEEIANGFDIRSLKRKRSSLDEEALRKENRLIGADNNSILNGNSHGQSSAPTAKPNAPELSNEAAATPSSMSFPLATLHHRLSLFTAHILSHPSVLTAPSISQSILRQELQIFLLAQVTHISDNLRLSQESLSTSSTSAGPSNHVTTTIPFHRASTSYYRWVHTTSADHTSCPYSFAFFVCLTRIAFPDLQAKYIAQDLASRLAVMCRQYNDYGSIARDRIEENLNSVNFPEFHAESRGMRAGNEGEGKGAGMDEGKGKNGGEGEEERRKEALFNIAEYEREGIMRAQQALEKRVEMRVIRLMDLFVGVTDLYGQIYVARDIASRMS